MKLWTGLIFTLHLLFSTAFAYEISSGGISFPGVAQRALVVIPAKWQTQDIAVCWENLSIGLYDQEREWVRDQ